MIRLKYILEFSEQDRFETGLGDILANGQMKTGMQIAQELSQKHGVDLPAGEVIQALKQLVRQGHLTMTLAGGKFGLTGG